MNHNFRNLKVWQKARLVTKDIYELTSNFPSGEKFGLSSQLRRAAVSIITNIAEGCGRGSNKELNHFLNIAVGSSNEVESLLVISSDLRLISDQDCSIITKRVIEIRKMLLGFQCAL